MTIKNIWSYLINGDNSFTVLQNVEELDATLKFNDTLTDVYKHGDKLAPVLLTVNPFNETVDKGADIKVMFKSGNTAVIKAWQAMVRCYVIIKVIETGTTVDISEIKLNR